jgi:hypothetical protein
LGLGFGKGILLLSDSRMDLNGSLNLLLFFRLVCERPSGNHFSWNISNNFFGLNVGVYFLVVQRKAKLLGFNHLRHVRGCGIHMRCDRDLSRIDRHLAERLYSDVVRRLLIPHVLSLRRF